MKSFKTVFNEGFNARQKKILKSASQDQFWDGFEWHKFDAKKMKNLIKKDAFLKKAFDKSMSPAANEFQTLRNLFNTYVAGDSNMERKYLSEASIGSEEDYRERFPKVADHFKDVKDSKHLAKLKKEAIKMVDKNEPGWKDGPITFFVKKWKVEFDKNKMTKRSASDIRADQILRTRDSSGRAKARKF